jgi:hypothetical protein
VNRQYRAANVAVERLAVICERRALEARNDQRTDGVYERIEGAVAAHDLGEGRFDRLRVVQEVDAYGRRPGAGRLDCGKGRIGRRLPVRDCNVREPVVRERGGDARGQSGRGPGYERTAIYRPVRCRLIRE